MYRSLHGMILGPSGPYNAVQSVMTHSTKMKNTHAYRNETSFGWFIMQLVQSSYEHYYGSPLKEHLLLLPFQPPAPFSLFAQAFVYTLLDLLYLFLLLRVVVSLPLLLLDVYALPTMAILSSQQETDQYFLFYSIRINGIFHTLVIVAYRINISSVIIRPRVISKAIPHSRKFASAYKNLELIDTRCPVFFRCSDL